MCKHCRDAESGIHLLMEASYDFRWESVSFLLIVYVLVDMSGICEWLLFLCQKKEQLAQALSFWEDF